MDESKLALTSDEEDVNAFAVYGTLRDDDDTGATWTADFLHGCNRENVCSGRVRGFEMYMNSDHNWPYALLKSNTEANLPANSSSAPPDSSTSPPASSSSSEGSASVQTKESSICVRYVPFDPILFKAKLAYADEIENYDPCAFASPLTPPEVSSSILPSPSSDTPISPLANNPAVEIRYDRRIVNVHCVAGGFCRKLDEGRHVKGVGVGVGNDSPVGWADDYECGCGMTKRAFMYFVRNLENGRTWTRLLSGNWLLRPKR